MDSFQLYLLCSLAIIFIIVGCIGNIISIIIFLKKEFITQSTTFYLIICSIINIISVLNLPVIIFPEIWTDSTVLCKTLGGFTLILLQLQSWVYVLCSLDRCLTTIVPVKFLWKNKMKFQTAIFLMCIFMIILLCAPQFYFYEKSIVVSSNETYSICSFPIGVSWIFPYFQYQFIFFRVIIPFTISIVASILTIYKLCASKRKIGKSEWKNMRREVQYSKALIIMDILFIIFRIPSLVNIIQNNSVTYIYTFNNAFFTIIGNVHNAFLFLIFIVFNRIYRKLLKQIMCCRKA
jgi:hypothetical protein